MYQNVHKNNSNFLVFFVVFFFFVFFFFFAKFRKLLMHAISFQLSEAELSMHLIP